MNLILFLGIGCFGMYLHWLKKWSRGEIESDLFGYIKTNPKHTIGAFVGMFIGVTTLVSLGQFDITSQNLALALLAGYGTDSMINKAP